MADDLIARLAIGEKLAAQRNEERRKLASVATTLGRYRNSVEAGGQIAEGAEYADFIGALFDLLGCDDLHEILRDVSPPDPDDIDLFGHPVLSLQSRLASALFDEGKQA